MASKRRMRLFSATYSAPSRKATPLGASSPLAMRLTAVARSPSCDDRVDVAGVARAHEHRARVAQRERARVAHLVGEQRDAETRRQLQLLERGLGARRGSQDEHQGGKQVTHGRFPGGGWPDHKPGAPGVESGAPASVGGLVRVRPPPPRDAPCRAARERAP